MYFGVCSLLAGQERHRILVQSLKLPATEAVRKNTKHFAVRSWCTVIYIVHLQTVKFYNTIRAHCTSNAQHSIYMYVCVYIHTKVGLKQPWHLERLFSAGEYEYLRSTVFGCFLVSKITPQMTTSSSGHSHTYTEGILHLM